MSHTYIMSNLLSGYISCNNNMLYGMSWYSPCYILCLVRTSHKCSMSYFTMYPVITYVCMYVMSYHIGAYRLNHVICSVMSLVRSCQLSYKVTWHDNWHEKTLLVIFDVMLCIWYVRWWYIIWWYKWWCMIWYDDIYHTYHHIL